MLFADSKSSENVPITIKNTRIERVYVAKFFGIYIGQNLTWKHHVSYQNVLVYCEENSIYWVVNHYISYVAHYFSHI